MIQVEWAKPESHILRWHFDWPWTWQEFCSVLAEANRMIDEVSGIADSIILASGRPIMPANTLSNLPVIAKERHPRHDLIVVVGSSSFTNELLRLSVQFIPGIQRQLHYVHSEDEALALIHLAQQQRANGRR